MFALLACVFAACGDGAPTAQPNVVMIIVDTLRADMVFVEHRRVETPGFDRLAKDGIVFTQAFSHAPMTLPSHTALFSSRPPFMTGVLNNYQDVGRDLPLVADWMREHGYDTRAVVSLGTLNPRDPDEPALDRGFARFDQDYWHLDPAPGALARIGKALDEADPSKPLFLLGHFADPHSPYNAHGSTERTVDVILDGELLETVATADMTKFSQTLELQRGRHVLEFRGEHEFRVNAFGWLDNGREGRFLQVNWEESKKREETKYLRLSIEVKTKKPNQSKLEFWISDVTSREEVTARYEGEVRFMDSYMGALADQLEARGMLDNTIVVFTSDHGEELGDRGGIGHVQTLHDELLHVPLMIRLPKGHRAEDDLRAIRDSLVPHEDIVPTLLELAGLPPLPGQVGTSLLRDRSPLLVAETHKPESRRNYVCFRDEEFKLIFDPDKDQFEMYDLAADPGEVTNVFDTKRGERADWPDKLRGVARLASRAAGDGETDAETRELLDALGYGGGDDSPR